MNAQIYVVTNKINGKQYVGQTINPHLPRGHGRLMKVAYKKYGVDGFDYKVIASGINNRNTLNCLERMWISIFNTISPNGYNIESGGSEKQVWSEQRRKAHSEAKIGRKINRPIGSKSGMKGKKFPEEGKIKLSIAMKGNKHMAGKKASEETRAKMSASQKAHWNSVGVHPNTGKKASLETKAKMSISHTGRVQSDEEKLRRSEAIKMWHKRRKEQS